MTHIPPGHGLEPLAGALRDAQDTQLSRRDDLGRVRAKLLAPRARRSRWLGWLAVPAMAAALAAIGLVVGASSVEPTAPLAVRVEGTELDHTARELHAAATALPVQFSDGSRLTLAPQTSAHLEPTRSNGASVRLTRGSLRAHIAHLPQRDWRFLAGPYEVRVVGTAFEVGWEPDHAHLVLQLTEGAVRVVGPGIDRVVRAGERLELGAPTETHASPARIISDAPISLPTPEEPVFPQRQDSPALPPTPGSAGRVAEPTSSPSNEPAVPPAAPPDWRALARAGHHAEALAQAESDGLAALLTTADARALLDLGDAARLGGVPRRAVTVYLAVRQRFAGSPEAAEAAYLLGRVHAEGLHRPDAAARWFGTHLEEAPRGALAREALGRRVESLRAAGDAEAARTAARTYLDAYASGPHAALCRTVLGE